MDLNYETQMYNVKPWDFMILASVLPLKKSELYTKAIYEG